MKQRKWTRYDRSIHGLLCLAVSIALLCISLFHAASQRDLIEVLIAGMLWFLAIAAGRHLSLSQPPDPPEED